MSSIVFLIGSLLLFQLSRRLASRYPKGLKSLAPDHPARPNLRAMLVILMVSMFFLGINLDMAIYLIYTKRLQEYLGVGLVGLSMVLNYISIDLIRNGNKPAKP